MVLLAIRDYKLEAYLGMHVALAKGAGVRQFGDAVRNEKSFLYDHPEDYALFALADVDDRSGRVTAYDVPLLLCNATEFQADLVGRGDV